MPVVNISSINDPRVAQYTKLTEAQLRNRLDPECGVFIAESPKVIAVAINEGYVPMSILCEERHIAGDAAFILDKFPEITVYTGSREVLSAITGYILTRGVLAVMHRPTLPSCRKLCSNARRIAVIYGVVDTTNIGAIFRSAAALGIDGVLLTPNSCDPLNRRSLRVSMGTILQIPWTYTDPELNEVRACGFKTVAMALSDNSIAIDSPELMAEPRLAIVLGTEGDGLPHKTITEADYVARIPMYHNVDSLNVAAASAVAFWQLRHQVMHSKL